MAKAKEAEIVKDIDEKRYTLTKEEQIHIAGLDYAVKYLDQSIKQFIISIMKERLSIDVSDTKVNFRIEDDELVIRYEE